MFSYLYKSSTREGYVISKVTIQSPIQNVLLFSGNLESRKNIFQGSVPVVLHNQKEYLKLFRPLFKK